MAENFEGGRGAMRYPPIGEHGIIGDLNTAALVAIDGTIDFFCFPDFDSPSIFAAILDADRGGDFRLCPTHEVARRQQIYLPSSNVLVTRFLSQREIVEITDFMPISRDGHPARIVRIVKAVRGQAEIALHCRPAFDYARKDTRAELAGGGRIVRFSGEQCPASSLSATVPLEVEEGAATGCFSLEDGEVAVLLLTCGSDEPDELDAGTALALQEETVRFWRTWIARSNFRGRQREMVDRSALCLKLLFSQRHGSMVAAPTFGLPEEIGGPRNWDYRYCWIRDSAFTIYALIRLGMTAEATDYMNWVIDRARESPESGTLQLMYRLDGAGELHEEELDHLEGYRGSRPVRIGNGAHDQLQLDIYGELMDALYLTDKHTHKVPLDAWTSITQIVGYVVEHWHLPDEGIWEIRSQRREFLHSRLMCWVALDRAIRIARHESLPAPLEDWRAVRDEIHADIMEHFWSEELRSFVQYKGADKVDASLLLMPLVKFISPVDPRWLSTLDLIGERLADDVLVHRYAKGAEDGFPESREGAFTICSFWYVECLARARRLEQARLSFEKLLSYANHLGLYSEQLDLDGSQLGNFPQAFTHLALISAAFALEEEERRT
ncbi:MAG TPA: glycoside hydrolase family 15 protein [Thermohalobaculum sp.]|nr:glycoside hydrolase family 15 protein [Thermohalobaculum sp.]